jgi:pyruvate ferredoxin oxidoreductase alpha subunit
MTCANRGVSAPITIWNDHQDSMTVRDAGWIHFFAENHQEAIEQHILAYKIAESLKIPVMVNVDGFVLTHTYESVSIPTTKEIKNFLPDYRAEKNTYLDTANPITMGAFTTPAHYMNIREELHNDIRESQQTIKNEYENLKKTIPSAIKQSEKKAIVNNGLIEYYGPKNPKTVIIAMGSVVGTIKDVIDEHNTGADNINFLTSGTGVIKIKTYRPFPQDEIVAIVKDAHEIAVIEKAISLGATDGPLGLDVKAAIKNKALTKVQTFVVGLGGRDITSDMIKGIIKEVRTKGDTVQFVK